MTATTARLIFDRWALIITFDFCIGERSFREEHRIHCFTDEMYRAAFTAAGLTVEHDTTGLNGNGVYLGRAGSM